MDGAELVDLRDQFLGDPVLREVAGGARLARLVDVGGVVPAGEDEDASVRMGGTDLGDRLDAVDLWHREVHQSQVGRSSSARPTASRPL